MDLQRILDPKLENLREVDRFTQRLAVKGGEDDFWRSRFNIRGSSAGQGESEADFEAVPTFLRPFMEQLLVTGKSLNLLQELDPGVAAACRRRRRDIGNIGLKPAQDTNRRLCGPVLDAIRETYRGTVIEPTKPAANVDQDTNRVGGSPLHGRRDDGMMAVVDMFPRTIRAHLAEVESPLSDYGRDDARATHHSLSTVSTQSALFVPFEERLHGILAACIKPQYSFVGHVLAEMLFTDEKFGAQRVVWTAPTQARQKRAEIMQGNEELNENVSTDRDGIVSSLKISPSLGTTCGLIRHLESLQALYFMFAGNIMHPFCEGIFKKLKSRHLWADPHLLNGVFMETIPEETTAVDVGRVRIWMRDSTEMMRRADDAGADEMLERIAVDYNVPWPLTTIIPPHSLKTYNQIFCLLIQVKHARKLLEMQCQPLRRELLGPHPQRGTARSAISSNPLFARQPQQQQQRQRSSVSLSAKENAFRSRAALRMELLHFVNGVYGYLMSAVLHTDSKAFLNEMLGLFNLDDMIALHDRFIRTARDRCFLNEKAAAILLHIRKALRICLSFADLCTAHDRDRTAVFGPLAVGAGEQVAAAAALAATQRSGIAPKRSEMNLRALSSSSVYVRPAGQIRQDQARNDDNLPPNSSLQPLRRPKSTPTLEFRSPRFDGGDHETAGEMPTSGASGRTELRGIADLAATARRVSGISSTTTIPMPTLETEKKMYEDFIQQAKALRDEFWGLRRFIVNAVSSLASHGAQTLELLAFSLSWHQTKDDLDMELFTSSGTGTFDSAFASGGLLRR
ncbi:Gamma-tubulin complex component 5 [Quaeritorhiza haematococci]|nr:Gamma-tubulin complex component 5 [Quaeritorhiza haematococci]